MSVANGAFSRDHTFQDAKSGRLAGLMPMFEMLSEPDPIATEREGRPIFRDKEVVSLITPGNPYNIPVETVTDEHRRHWPEKYKAFKSGYEISADGTPLEQWPILRPAQVRELKAIELYTVEHVANMNDHVCQRFMGGMRLRTLAKAFLDDAEAGSQLAKATADSERKDARIAELDAKVEQLSALLNQVHTQLQEQRNAAPAAATFIPGMADPVEQAKQQPVGGQSSLMELPEPRRKRKADGS